MPRPVVGRGRGYGGHMRAMVYRDPYRVRVEDEDVPGIEHPNDAIVRVTRARSVAPTCTSATG